MDRRSFITAAAVGVATGTDPNIVAARPALADVTPETYRELAELIQDHTPKSDAIRRLHVLALVHARRWAHEVGITFTWDLRERPTNYPWRCTAWLDGVRLDYEDEWNFAISPTSDEPSQRAIVVWGEGRLAMQMMSTFCVHSRDGQCNYEFCDTDSGGIAYSA